MAIYIIDGYTGHGKTAYAVKWVRDLLLADRQVFSNIKLFPEKMHKSFQGLKLEGDIRNDEDRKNKKPILYWRDFDDWRYMQNGTILCDEGGVLFNARLFDSLSPEIQNKLQQHRHERLDLILTVPHWTRVDVIIRQLVERFIHCELILGSEKFGTSFFPRISRITEHRLENMIRIESLGRDSLLVDPPLWTEHFWISKKVQSWYDTGEMVSSSRPMAKHKTCAKHTRYICVECERDALDNVNRPALELTHGKQTT